MIIQFPKSKLNRNVRMDESPSFVLSNNVICWFSYKRKKLFDKYRLNQTQL